MKKISLSGIWTLKGKPQDSMEEPISLSAQVPGCVQLDLSAAGLLPSDLLVGENILEAEKYEHHEWWYERTFASPEEKENVYLVFEGVDCLAEYYLNGIKLGESDNMFISHEFRIDDYLEDGENTLTVHLRSAILAADTEDYPIRLLRSLN